MQPLIDDEIAVQHVKIDRIRAGARVAAEDDIAVEAPLEIRVGGKALTVVMRTPGHDEELARGFLYAESLVDGAADIVSITRPGRAHRRRGGQRRRRDAAPRRAHARRRAALLRVVVVRRVRQERHQRAARARAGRLVVAARGRGHARRRCPIACAPHSRCSRAPAACTPPGSSPPTARSSSRAKTSAATTRSTRSSAGRSPPAGCRSPIACSSSPAASATRSCKRPSPPACRSSPPSARRRRWRSISPKQFEVTLVGFLRDGGMNVYTHGDRVM